MPLSADVSELLLKWWELKARGETPDVRQLCGERVELVDELERQIHVIVSFESLLELRDGSNDRVTSGWPLVSDHSHEGAIGQTIAGYELLEVLGEGGMGVVYKARQVSLDRLVALKMMSHTRAGSKQLARFEVEAAAIAKMQHPHIVQVFELGVVAGLPFFTMEMVGGGNLAERLKLARPSPRRAAQLVAVLARAMHAVHQQGIVHRDLKPANVLLADQGPSSVEGLRVDPWADCLPKISDFGLAKRLDDDSSPTQTGEILGTPNYMAPEQAEGRIDQVGPATDIYALGAILYELLTGRAPFAGAAGLGILQKVIAEEPEPPSRLDPRVPRDLEAICLKCLGKQPQHRYVSAAALAEDLSAFLAGHRVTARSISVFEQTHKWAKRHPVHALLAVGALALAGVVAGIMGVHLHRVLEVRRAAVAAAPRAREILSRHCFECHGEDPNNVKRGLAILEHAVLTDPRRKIVVPFEPERSRIVQRIEDGSMPPEEDELRLPRVSQVELNVLKIWIAGGAPPFPAEDSDRPTPPVVPYSELAAEVRRIFGERCFECHRSSVAKGGIKILNHDLLVLKREMVRPGQPDESPLLSHLTSDDETMMPPPPRAPLSTEEIATIRRWIEAGAPPFPKSP